jgi:hypothetical protein
MIGLPPQTDTRAGFTQLLSLELGDIVTLPDGRQLTVRALERTLRTPVGSMHGFVLGGEVGPQATLLSIPAGPDAPVVLYTPLEHIPASARDARPVVEGVVSYWAPHLPNLSGAMGELGFKVCAIRGQIDPMVLMWRGHERVVFVRSAVASLSQLGFLCMSRDPSATEIDQARHAARVVPAGIGIGVPDTEHAGGLYHQFTSR